MVTVGAEVPGGIMPPWVPAASVMQATGRDGIHEFRPGDLQSDIIFSPGAA